VIAQSNYERVMVTPIERLGGPGMVPVRFLKFRDLRTGVEIEDPVQAIQDARVTSVKNWELTSADYKKGLIPL
jgi:bud emergence protein 1